MPKKKNVNSKEQNSIDDYLGKYERDQIKFVTRALYSDELPDKIKETQKFDHKRVVVVTHYRVLFFKKNVLRAVYCDNDQHLLDLKRIAEGPISGSITLEFLIGEDIKYVTLDFKDSPNEFIKHIASSYDEITQGWWDRCKFEIGESFSNNKVSPNSVCCGAIETYKAYCNYEKVPVSQSFMSYLQEKYENNDTEINFSEIPGIHRTGNISFHLIPIAKMLQQNIYFTKIKIGPFNEKVISQVIEIILMKNHTIGYVDLDGSNATITSATLFFLSDSIHKLQILILSNCEFSSENAESGLVEMLLNCKHSIKVLDLHNLKFKERSLISLFSALRQNWGLSINITAIDIGGISITNDAQNGFVEWVSNVHQHSNLEKLCIANTGLDLSHLLGYFEDMKYLRYLDVSGLKFCKSTHSSFIRLLSTAKSLKTIIASNCCITGETFKHCVERLIENDELSDLYLDVSYNTLDKYFLRDAALLKKVKCLKGINLSACGLKGQNGANVLKYIPSNIEIVQIDYNFKSNKLEMAKAISVLIGSHETLRYLSMKGEKSNYLGKFLHNAFEGIRISSNLLEIDFSGQRGGDSSILAFADAMKDNNTVCSINIDGNKVTTNGLLAIKSLLDYNNTIKYIAYPTHDASKANCLKFNTLMLDIIRETSSNGKYTLIKLPNEFKEEWKLKSEPEPLAEVPSFLNSIAEQEAVHDKESRERRKSRRKSKRLTTFMDEDFDLEKALAAQESETEGSSLSMSVPPPTDIPTRPKENEKKTPRRDVDDNTSNTLPPPVATIPPIKKNENTLPPAASIPAPKNNINLPPPPSGNIPKIVETPPPASGERKGLLSDIQGFKKNKLKKAETNDKSAPVL